MAFPFFTRPSPAPGPAPRPVFNKPTESLKPAVKPGILGERGFSTFLQMKGFAKKAPFKPAPTYGKQLGKQERVGMIKTLQKYSGQIYGLSEGKYNEALNKMKKEKYLAGIKHDYKKAKELDQQIKQLSVWEKK